MTILMDNFAIFSNIFRILSHLRNCTFEKFTISKIFKNMFIAFFPKIWQNFGTFKKYAFVWYSATGCARGSYRIY